MTKTVKITKEFEEIRNKEVVALVDRVIRSPFKPTGIKIELEGAMGRTNKCGVECSTYLQRRPHMGCKYFNDTRVANDFVLAYLEQFGLSEKLPENEWGKFQYSYTYIMKKPCAFSRVYTDSETEWTITLLLDKAENVLYLPHIIDAFNALAKANGTKKINVSGSGLHTAFIQGKDGVYPSSRDDMDFQRFDNFSKSMTPLLPALFFLGSNRMSRGKAITRSFGCRQPAVSGDDKYSAIAYRHGALEFRVFDTCYDDREHVLDNVAVMARSVAKYWRKEYRNPQMDKFLTKPVYFGNNKMGQAVNKLDDCFTTKEQIQLLNEGLRRIKPTYYSIKDVKTKRKFKKTQNSCKPLDFGVYRADYKRYLAERAWNLQMNIARDVYYFVDQLPSSEFSVGLSKVVDKKREEVAKHLAKKQPVTPFEEYAMNKEMSGAKCIGGK